MAHLDIKLDNYCIDENLSVSLVDYGNYEKLDGTLQDHKGNPASLPEGYIGSDKEDLDVFALLRSIYTAQGTKLISEFQHKIIEDNEINCLMELHDFDSQEYLLSLLNTKDNTIKKLKATDVLSYLILAKYKLCSEINIKYINENSRLKQIIILLNKKGIDFKDGWSLLKNNKTLQKAILAADESGVDINTRTINFLNNNPNVTEIIAQSYDHIESMDTSCDKKEKFQIEARSHRNELVKHIINNDAVTSKKSVFKDGALTQLVSLNHLTDGALDRSKVKKFRDNSIKTKWWKSTAAKVVLAAVAVIGISFAGVVTFGTAPVVAAVSSVVGSSLCGVTGSSISGSIGLISCGGLAAPKIFKSQEEKAVTKVANAAKKSLS
ncbi:hypothetical protein L3V82_04270 [Thiotrichales bacterium 19S3-7]|nr:hypothetical protein [Thiotrichales bacterium 19S3-7]